MISKDNESSRNDYLKTGGVERKVACVGDFFIQTGCGCN